MATSLPWLLKDLTEGKVLLVTKCLFNFPSRPFIQREREQGPQSFIIMFFYLLA